MNAMLTKQIVHNSKTFFSSDKVSEKSVMQSERVNDNVSIEHFPTVIWPNEVAGEKYSNFQIVCGQNSVFQCYH